MRRSPWSPKQLLAMMLVAKDALSSFFYQALEPTVVILISSDHHWCQKQVDSCTENAFFLISKKVIVSLWSLVHL